TLSRRVNQDILSTFDDVVVSIDTRNCRSRTMTQILPPYKVLIVGLRFKNNQLIFGIPQREEAYKYLKEITGLDFGYDADQWENWMDNNAHEFRRMYRKWTQKFSPPDPGASGIIE